MEEKIKELVRVFDTLCSIDSVGGFGNITDETYIAFIIKRIHILMLKLFPEGVKEKDVIFLKNNGDIVEYGTSKKNTGEFIMHQSIGNSKLYNILLGYYQESPYWRCEPICLELSDEERKNLSLYLQKLEGVFDSHLMAGLENEDNIEAHPLYGLLLLCGLEEDVCDDAAVLTSYLLPYYKEKEEFLKEKNAELCSIIDKTEKMLSVWMEGGSFSVISNEAKKAYYVMSDNSSAAYGWYGGGCLEINLSIAVAGKLIDMAIFLLDEKYPFLPEFVKEGKGDVYS